MYIKKLDKLAEEFIRDNNAKPGFLGMYGFPNTLCVSPNNEVVHGIPNDKPFENGDIISIDCGVLKNGFYGDHAYTFEVGDVSNDVKNFYYRQRSLFMLVLGSLNQEIELEILVMQFRSLMKIMAMVSLKI